MTRFIVPEAGRDAFVAGAQRLVAALADRPGHRGSRLAQALDEPDRWLLISEWDGVGSWRRALSGYDVRVEVIPLMAQAESEPGVYGVSHEVPGG